MADRKELESILRSIQGKFSRFYSKILTEKNLTIPQFSLLILIVDEGSLRMNEIAEKLYLASSSITNLVDRLEKQKLIKRVKDSKDRRVYFIQVTESGKSVVSYIRKMTVGRIAKQLGAFSGGEVKTIKKFYEAINVSLDTYLNQFFSNKG